MRIEISDSFEPITEDVMRRFEYEIGVEFPPEYRQFLLSHNGGKPSPSQFDVDIDGFMNSSSIIRFLGFHDTESYSFSRYLRTYKGRLPNNLLPIAVPLAVDLICLSVHGEDYGKIYFWDHNWEVTEREPDYSNVHFLADSFGEFLDKLYADEEENANDHHMDNRH